jgi:transitional endoplasmic reticulum ATPase
MSTTDTKKATKTSAVVTADKVVAVERTGKKIILPPGMSYKDAHEWLERQEKAEESPVRIMTDIPCFPFDGIIALSKALAHTYGYIEAEMKGFFGEKQPPIHVKVPLADGTYANAVLGQIRNPKWEGGYIEAKVEGASIIVRGEVKKKFEVEVNEILDLTKKMIREESIYRGQAIHMDLSWMAGERDFNVMEDSPKFIQTGDAKLILNRQVEDQLNTSVFMLIERTEACVANGIPLKHGALFQGPFGTGKTMTAKVIARKSVQNGWTFIYLSRAEDLAHGLRIAKMYAPAVIFAEDIDTAVNERDADMNDILNTIDGIDTKDTPVVTVLTTNKVEDIEPAFLRAGRIDTVIHYLPPDGETAGRFVTELGGDLLADDVDVKKAGAALEGLVAAFIAEAVSKAKRMAIYRTGNADITGQITTEDLLRAAEIVKHHASMMKPKDKTRAELIAEAVELIHTPVDTEKLADAVAERL